MKRWNATPTDSIGAAILTLVLMTGSTWAIGTELFAQTAAVSQRRTARPALPDSSAARVAPRTPSTGAP